MFFCYERASQCHWLCHELLIKGKCLLIHQLQQCLDRCFSFSFWHVQYSILLQFVFLHFAKLCHNMIVSSVRKVNIIMLLLIMVAMCISISIFLDLKLENLFNFSNCPDFRSGFYYSANVSTVSQSMFRGNRTVKTWRWKSHQRLSLQSYLLSIKWDSFWFDGSPDACFANRSPVADPNYQHPETATSSPPLGRGQPRSPTVPHGDGSLPPPQATL